jgi:hypothetical protein
LELPDGGLQIDRDIPVGDDALQLAGKIAQSSALVDVPPPARH